MENPNEFGRRFHVCLPQKHYRHLSFGCQSQAKLEISLKKMDVAKLICMALETVQYVFLAFPANYLCIFLQYTAYHVVVMAAVCALYTVVARKHLSLDTSMFISCIMPTLCLHYNSCKSFVIALVLKQRYARFVCRSSCMALTFTFVGTIAD